MNTPDRADAQIATLIAQIDVVDDALDDLTMLVGGTDPGIERWPRFVQEEFDRLHARRDELDAQLAAFRLAQGRS